MLHSIDTTDYSKDALWCGPGAISTLTGIPIRAATEMLARIGGRNYMAFDGACNEEVIIALHELGYGAKDIGVPARYPNLTHGPTLDRFIGDRTVFECSMPMLIQITGHFVTAHWGYMSDNWTGRPVPASQFPKMKRLVKAAWTIERIKT